MELVAFARRVLTTPDLAVKLERVREPWTDTLREPAVRLTEPARPESLRFAARRAAPPMPHPDTFTDERKRGIAHHIMANHELQALEVMAWVLLAFPEAPAEFRLGLVQVMEDEQRHTQMHCERAASLGTPFGSLPVNCYIWKKAMSFLSPLDYLAGLPLVFEGRNLDHTLEFEEYFLAVGDRKSAAMMRRIHEDEIEHVAFGIRWLREFKEPGQSDWDAFCQHLHWPLRPNKAIGERFDVESRVRAGLSADFIEKLQASAINTSDPQEQASE